METTGARPVCCGVCTDKFNKTSRKPIECLHCNYVACATCVQTYMLSSVLDPHCMNPDCRAVWNRGFLDDNLTKAFLNGDLRKHREEVLLNRERARMPATQPLVAEEQRKRRLRTEIADLHAERKRMKVEMRVILDTIDAKHNAIALGDGAAGSGNAEERRAFVRACPIEQCKGFLSTRWKCGICSTQACPDCHEVVEPGHVCTQANIDTARLLARDTKPCPSCGTGITKIDGCFALDTPILMWNGSMKKSQDIAVGDVLVGDDGSPRTVQHLVSGTSAMFEVRQRNGIDYTVNGKHTLVLKFSSDRQIYWNNSERAWRMKWFDVAAMKMTTKKFRVTEELTSDDAKAMMEAFKTTLTHPYVYEILVEDFVKLHVQTQRHFMGFKCEGINWPKTDVAMDPWLVGAFLGDGFSCGEGFAANPVHDQEILDYIFRWCEDNGAQLVHGAAYRFRIRGFIDGSALPVPAIGYGSCSDTCKGCLDLFDQVGKTAPICDTLAVGNLTGGKGNTFKGQLRQYELIGDKHIPCDYLANDRSVRLQLLAGFIDTDGSVPKRENGRRAVISQTRLALGEQLVVLARTLGFQVGIARVPAGFEKGPTGELHTRHQKIVINISGRMLDEVPTVLPRKLCTSSSPNNDPYRTGITVASAGEGAYFGWVVDGNHRFCLGDCTVVHNCNQMWCTSCHVAFSWDTGRLETSGRVHNPHFFEWQRQQRGNPERAPGDIRCGGLPGYNDFREVADGIHHAGAFTPYDFDLQSLLGVYRSVVHLQDYTIPRLVADEGGVDTNADLRIAFMLNEVDEAGLRHRLQKREKQREKDREVRLVFEMYAETVSDLIRNLVAAPTEETIGRVALELPPLRDYANAAMASIARRFSGSCPLITSTGSFARQNGRTAP